MPRRRPPRRLLLSLSLFKMTALAAGPQVVPLPLPDIHYTDENYTPPFGVSLGRLFYGPTYLEAIDPWPYLCLPPLPLGTSCREDNECNTERGGMSILEDGVNDARICHPIQHVCSLPLGQDAYCYTGLGCHTGLGCKLIDPPAEPQCYTLRCDDAQGSCEPDVPTGQACPNNVQCNGQQDQTEMCVPPTTPPGTCQPLPKANNEDCSGYLGLLSCPVGLFCEAASGKCRPRAAEGKGGPCPALPDLCNVTQGLVCSAFPTDDTRDRVCIKARTRGEPCADAMQCAKGLHCGYTSQTCEPNLSPAGMACSYGNECGERLPFDDHIGTECIRGVCVDATKEGARCFPTYPTSQCLGGRICRRERVEDRARLRGDGPESEMSSGSGRYRRYYV